MKQDLEDLPAQSSAPKAPQEESNEMKSKRDEEERERERREKEREREREREKEKVRRVRKPDHTGRGRGLPNGPPTLPWRHWEKPGQPEFASRKGGKLLSVYGPLPP